MKKEFDLKDFNLPKKWNNLDLSYRYGKIILDKIHPSGLAEDNNGVPLKAIDLKNDLHYVKQLLKKIDPITLTYLKAKKDDLLLKALKKQNDDYAKLDFHFEVITAALLEARNHDEHSSEVHTDLFETLLYMAWFLASFKTANLVFDKIVKKTFSFPDIDFDMQFQMCCQAIEKQIKKNGGITKQRAKTLEAIFHHFLFHYSLIEAWKSEEAWKPENNFSVTNPEILKLEHKIYEWIFITYLLPLYVAVNGYDKTDVEFVKLTLTLFNFEHQFDLINYGIKLLLKSKEVIDTKNLNLINLFTSVESKCYKIQDNYFAVSQTLAKSKRNLVS